MSSGAYDPGHQEVEDAGGWSGGSRAPDPVDHGSDNQVTGTQALLDAVAGATGTRVNSKTYTPSTKQTRDGFDEDEKRFEERYNLDDLTTVDTKLEELNARKWDPFNYKRVFKPDWKDPTKKREYIERSIGVSIPGIIAGLITGNVAAGAVVGKFTDETQIGLGTVGGRPQYTEGPHGLEQVSRADTHGRGDDDGENQDPSKRIFRTASQQIAASKEADEDAVDAMIDEIKSQLPLPARERDTSVHNAQKGLSNPLGVLFKMLNLNKV